MKIKSKEIRKILIKSCPKLEFIWLTDPIYSFPTMEELETIVHINSVKDMSFIDKGNACEEFSLHLLSAIRLYRYNEKVKKGKYINWAVGMTGGEQRIESIWGRSKLISHNLLLSIIDSNKVVIIEPQDDSIENINEDLFSPRLLWM